MRRRVTTGALVLVTLCALVVGSALASDLDAMWMSLTPGGPAQTDFPSGTETVYLVLEYTDFVSENVRVMVSDYSGTTVFQTTRTFSGSGIGSVPITYGQTAFPDGPYVTTLYFAGHYLTRAVEWTVGGVDSPPMPTAFPPARLEVAPAILTFSAVQGGSNPPAQRVLVSNSTAAASVWQATVDTPWLRVTPEGGETPALLRISVDVAGLPAGAYAGHVTVSADGIEGSPQTVDVALTVSPPSGTTTLDLPAVADGTGWVVSDVLESLVRESDVGVMRLRYAPSPTQPSGLADVEDGLFVWDASGILRVNFQVGSDAVTDLAWILALFSGLIVVQRVTR